MPDESESGGEAVQADEGPAEGGAAKLARKDGFFRCMSHAEKCECPLGPVHVMHGVRCTVK